MWLGLESAEGEVEMGSHADLRASPECNGVWGNTEDFNTQLPLLLSSLAYLGLNADLTLLVAGVPQDGERHVI